MSDTTNVPGSDQPISYTVLPLVTPVKSGSGETIGMVEHVLEDRSLDLFDGIVIATDHGLRFVDRDAISLITERAVQTDLTDDAVGDLPAPDGDPVYRVDALQDVGSNLTARLGRMFRREHWKLDK